MPLTENLITLHRRLNALPSRFGVPQYRIVVLEKPDGTYEQITPNPQVRSMPTRMIGRWLNDAVQISGSELIVEGISREYDLETLKASRYLVDPIWQETLTNVPLVVDGVPVFDAEGNQVVTEVLTYAWVGGIRCSCEAIDQNQITMYSATLSPRYTK